MFMSNVYVYVDVHVYVHVSFYVDIDSAIRRASALFVDDVAWP